MNILPDVNHLPLSLRKIASFLSLARFTSVVLFLVLFSCSGLGQVSLNLQQNDSAAIPGSQRTFYANIVGTTNQGVNWSVTGGCTLSSATGTPVVVTAPAVGGRCVSSPTSAISFSSPVSCQITATAQDTSHGVQTASTTLPVCAPDVALSVFPQTTVLYKGQTAVIQSDLRGSVQTGVTWNITTNPGSLGTLAGGSANRHAVFSAAGAGTYVLTATSVADHTKTAATTIYVTNNAPPTVARVDHTEPVDCTAVGSGQTYEVGPARAYTDLNLVPWTALGPGDTVRIHNDDLTGTNPTVYNQRITLPGTGSATQPLRVCGVPDANGVKPILDGANATTRADANWAGGYLESLAVIMLYDSVHKGDATFDQNSNILIEGLHVRNANPNVSYLPQHGGSSTPYNGFAACIWVQTGQQVLLRGNEIDHCAQSIFTNSTTPAGALVQDVTVEGNYTHDWGFLNSYTSHDMYLQTIGLTVQFNFFGPSVAGAMGNVVKSRSVLNFLRWNYLSQPVTTTARAFDLVEPQSFNCYVIPYQFAKAYHGSAPSDCGQPYVGADTYSADQVAANFEAYHSDFVYGNVMDDTGSSSGFIHYGYDQQTTQGPLYTRRGGTLFSWNNTHLTRQTTGQKVIIETATPDQGHSYEFPTVQSVNNVFAASNSAISFLPTTSLYQAMNLNTNWMQAGYGLPWRLNNDTYMGGTTLDQQATCDLYGSCAAANGHLGWARNNTSGTAAATLFTGTTAPFNQNTFMPSTTLQGLATTLPTSIADQPSNMQFLPATNTITQKLDQSFLGALDTNIIPTIVTVAKTAPVVPTIPVPAKPVAASMVVTPNVALIPQGQPLTVTVNLSGNNGVPTGVITYMIDADFYNVPVNPTGLNSFVFPASKGVGLHDVRVVYSGSNKYALGSPEQRLNLIVIPQASN